MFLMKNKNKIQILLKMIEIIKTNKKVGKWVPLCCTLGAVWIFVIYYYRSVKFESNE
ncbi:hypothetical protein FWK35_00000662 [Aphis craccivora]|uniref:Uncharacterized protein n=1 Tax=Aphis craccivora TaxID=307492 RepID=A0A6G0ZR79_APHCR|nr:hypothetical protein FWK35_00000662 [Aphis craccivora]